MTTSPVSVRSLADEVWAAIGGQAGKVYTEGPVNLFRGRVEQPPLDADGRVHAYAVLYSSPGRRSSGRVGSTADRLDGGFQVTCVGGDETRCLWCIDQVVGALTGVAVTVPGRSRRARVVEDESNATRYVLVDEDVSPPRHFVPLLFRLRV